MKENFTSQLWRKKKTLPKILLGFILLLRWNTFSRAFKSSSYVVFCSGMAKKCSLIGIVKDWNTICWIYAVEILRPLSSYLMLSVLNRKERTFHILFQKTIIGPVVFVPCCRQYKVRVLFLELWRCQWPFNDLLYTVRYYQNLNLPLILFIS